MHVVVNHLHFAEPVTGELLEEARAMVDPVLDAGATGFYLARVDSTHLILLLDFPDAETADRVAREVGGPWICDHVAPLLDRPTERSVGEIVVSGRSG
jgi:hypothetical protein